MRPTALEYDAVQQRVDRETHPAASELADLRLGVDIYRERLADAAGVDARIVDRWTRRLAELESRIGALETRVNERRTWRFADIETEWRHDVLRTLVERLASFTADEPAAGTIAEVERTLDAARRVERMRQDPEARAAWREAAADIEQSDRYGGLALEPQIGLLPLRKDPKSGLWEFWYVPSGARPQPDESGSTRGWRLERGMGFVMVLLPGGRFLMGAQRTNPQGPNYDPNADPDEAPVHEIELAPFFLSKFEMTKGQWLDLAGAPAFASDLQNTPHQPMVGATWDEADRLLAQLGLRLPTEAQFEYANRAGTTTAWWTGQNPDRLQGRVTAGSASNVGSAEPNAFGLHDLAGGVWEFCRDVMGSYDWGAPEHPSAGVAPRDGERQAADIGMRIVRGGNGLVSLFSRSANRSAGQRHQRTMTVGIRPARALD